MRTSNSKALPLPWMFCPRNPAVAAVLFVIFQAARIGDPDAGEGEAFLLLQVRDLSRDPVAQGMRLAGREVRVKQAGHVLGLHRPVGHARAADIDLDQGLEPQKAARAVADELDGDSASPRLRDDGCGGLP